jgi:hypothetical protein
MLTASLPPQPARSPWGQTAYAAAVTAVAFTVPVLQAAHRRRPHPLAASASLAKDVAAPVCRLVQEWFPPPPSARSTFLDAAVPAVVVWLDARDAARRVA